MGEEDGVGDLFANEGMKPSTLFLVVLGALCALVWALAVDVMQGLHRQFHRRLWSETLHLR